MSGIAGFVNFQNAEPIREQDLVILKKMGAQLKRRGPDGQSYYSDESMAVFFSELRIFNSGKGTQPFYSEDKNIILVVDGEIYNYRTLSQSLKDSYSFKTQSNCEVLLPLYQKHGLDFLQDVNGMFAICIWDKKAKRLVLAKDRFGIRPLYYCLLPTKLLFASELKALFVHPDCPKELNWDEVFRYDATMFVDNIPSFFQGIRNLPGGSLAVVDIPRQKTKEIKYWDIKQPSADEYRADSRSSEQIIEEYRLLLEEAVHLNLATDAPMGVFLSGGIDSSSIAALSSKYVNLQTFSVLSQSTLNEDAHYSHKVAKLLGIPNHQVLFDWHKNLVDAEQWKELLWMTEHPLCTAEHLYKFKIHEFAKSHYPNLKTMLLGQGSDEFNSGLGSQNSTSSVSWDDIMHVIERQIRFELHLYPDMRRIDLNFRNFPLLNFNYLLKRNEQSEQDDLWYLKIVTERKKLQTWTLWHEDRTAAGNGMESRMPFLDHRFAEFSIKVPPDKRPQLFFDKYILRQAMLPYLPEEIRTRKKVPFYGGSVDTRFTSRLLYNILMSNNQALLEEAFGDSNHPHPVVSQQSVKKIMTNIAQNPEYEGVFCIFLLTNAALLEKMAQNADRQVFVEAPISPMPEIIIENWEEEFNRVQLLLGMRRDEITGDTILKFKNTNTFLVKEVSEVNKNFRYFLVVDNNLDYFFDEDDNPYWIVFLSRIDGKKSIHQILQELRIEESVIRKDLEEALDYHILQIVSD